MITNLNEFGGFEIMRILFGGFKIIDHANYEWLILVAADVKLKFILKLIPNPVKLLLDFQKFTFLTM